MDEAYYQRYRHVLGKEVRRLREEQHHSLRSFAAMIDIDYKHLFNIEHGNISPTLDMMVKIADGLGVDPASLIDTDLL